MTIIVGSGKTSGLPSLASLIDCAASVEVGKDGAGKNSIAGLCATHSIPRIGADEDVLPLLVQSSKVCAHNLPVREPCATCSCDSEKPHFNDVIWIKQACDKSGDDGFKIESAFDIADRRFVR